MKNIEIEVRSFITQKQYKELIKRLNKKAKFRDEIREETIYFNGSKDLRIRNNGKNAFIILKGGKIHDRWREELEVKCNSKDFRRLEKLFQKLGYKIRIKWFRKRRLYKLNGINIFLDYTKGYGYIIELEMIISNRQIKTIQRKLKDKLKSLGIKITPKKEFDAKFKYYKEHWKKILKHK